MKARVGVSILTIIAVLLPCSFAQAGLITGTQVGNADTSFVAPYWGAPDPVVFGLSGSDLSGVWIYGPASWIDWPDPWAIAPGVTDVSQIVDASLYPLNVTTGYLPLGAFAVAKGKTGGHWGVMTTTAISYDFTEQRYKATYEWWYQDDGTADFSSVPDPGSTLLLLGMGIVGLRTWRKSWR